MNLIGLIRLLLPLIIELIGNLKNAEDCPEEADDLLHQAEVLNFSANYTFDEEGTRAQSIGDWIKCVDFNRLFAALKEIVQVISDARNQCPPIGEVESE